MQKNGLISVIKHYPGHGATKRDSHYGLPIIARRVDRIENDDIIPFKKAINDGADCIMVGHLIVKNIDKIFPVSLSKKIINQYLRQKLEYDGVVMTDDIKMQAVSFFYGVKFAIKRALLVGHDIIMMRLGYKKEKKLINHIIKNEKLINNIGLDRKVERILNLKEKYNINNNPSNGCDVNSINERIIELNNTVEES